LVKASFEKEVFKENQVLNILFIISFNPISLEWTVEMKESRFFTSADDKVEITLPILAEAETGNVIHIFRIGATDEERYLASFEILKPFFKLFAARPEIRFRSSLHSWIISSKVLF